MKGYRFGLTACFLLLGVASAAARAGGGGGAAVAAGGCLSLILLPFALIYAGIMTWQVRKKSKACKELLARLEKQDAAWDPDEIRHRIDEVFFKVQQAWMERNQDLARDCMSAGLYQKHKLQTDQMLAQHRKNVLENINLTSVDIVDVEDFVDNRKDRFWANLEGSMTDYTVDETTNQVVKGDSKKTEHFNELWKFVRSGNTWVLDQIDQDVSISELKGFQAKTETPGI